MLWRLHHYMFGGAAVFAAVIAVPRLPAQKIAEAPRVSERRLSLDTPRESQRRGPRQTAAIHWQGVPLGEAIARLKPLFAEMVFVDRRVDPELRVTLDIEASSAEQVVAAVAAAQELGVARFGKVIYLGPATSAAQLKAVAAARAKAVSLLPAALRTSFASRRTLDWPRLAEPRSIVESVVQQSGWKIGNPEQLPFDLWQAGHLPELNLTEQLTLLLAGFDLTFDVKPDLRTIEIVSLTPVAKLPVGSGTHAKAVPKADATRPAKGKQTFSLRVEEKPVGSVLRQLATKLNWALQIDEEAIRAAGLSLDKRVSFSVEQADQEKLLEALLTPAGLEYTIEGNQVRVMPKRYGDR